MAIAAIRGRRAGRAAGRSAGFAQGYHSGRCEAVRARAVLPSPAVRDLKVLYIPQGFDAIDSGVIGALQRTVSELIVGTPHDILAQAELHRPHLVLVLNGLHVFPDNHLEQVDRIRQLGIRTAIWFADDPYFTDYTAVIAPRYDVVITHEQSCVPFYTSLGCPQVYYMALAADTELFRPQRVEPAYRSDVCFIGMAFWNRVSVFDQIARGLKGRRVMIGGGLWDRLSNYRLLKPFIRSGWIPVEESVKYYSGAKIVINLHRSHDHHTDNKNKRGIPASSVNPRTYEISACGTLQLTDVRSDLTNYYTPGVDLDIYRSPKELIHKINYYLSHNAVRKEMAYNGLRRTLVEHSFVSRVDRLLALLLEGAGAQSVQ